MEREKLKTRSLKELAGIFLIFISLSSCLQNSDKAESDNEYCGYLFAYFEGSGTPELQEQLRFAISRDAVNWYALNSNNPVISSDTISCSGGIRDPHILRGENGDGFYMVATDMFTVKNGWGENPGIVLMKSDNLIDWKHSYIELAKEYPENFGDAHWVWAPQTIYDPSVKKYMIYFTLNRKEKGGLVTYYAYANKDFSGFEDEPKILFDARFGSIDNDIIYKDGLWHLFYKGNTKDENGKEIINGIQKAVSSELHGEWKEDFKYIDAYAGKTPVEGSSVFKLNDSDTYILMYDLYTSGKFEYQTSRDLITFDSVPKSFSKDFNPRHGSVISIIRSEMDMLEAKWGKKHFVSNGNPLIQHKHTADPAAVVFGDSLWLFTGHDFEGNQNGYKLKDWCVFSTSDMKNWTEYPVPLSVSDFK